MVSQCITGLIIVSIISLTFFPTIANEILLTVLGIVGIIGLVKAAKSLNKWSSDWGSPF